MEHIHAESVVASRRGVFRQHRLHAFQKLALVLVCAMPLPAAHAQDDTTGWPGFNADNTVRGTVTTAAPSTFTIRTDDGASYKVLYSVNSRFLIDRGPAKAADIHQGDMLIAVGDLDTSAKTIGAAVLIGVSAEAVRKAREGLGKTWTAGKITSIAIADEPKIALARLDGVAQTIEVDENTSFKRHHDSITMADIKVGEGLHADGHLVGKIFLATTVNVFAPGEHAATPSEHTATPGEADAGTHHP